MHVPDIIRYFADSHPHPVVLTDADLVHGPKIIYANSAFFQMCGYVAAQVIGQTPRMFQGRRTNRAAAKKLKRAAIAGQTHKTRLLNYRKNGEEYLCEIEIRPLYMENESQPKYFIALENEVPKKPGRRKKFEASA